MPAYNRNTLYIRTSAYPANSIVLYRVYRIAGQTLNAAGAPLPSAEAMLFRASDEAFIERQTSDSGGNYAFTVFDAANYWVASLKKEGRTADSTVYTADSTLVTADSGSQITGMTVDTLVGT